LRLVDGEVGGDRALTPLGGEDGVGVGGSGRGGAWGRGGGGLECYIADRVSVVLAKAEAKAI